MSCTETCGIDCLACGRVCTATCSECQQLNLPVIRKEREIAAMMSDLSLSDPSRILVRSIHIDHQCERERETCGHSCKSLCGPDHHHNLPYPKTKIDLISVGCDITEPADQCMEVDLVGGRLCELKLSLC